MADEQRIDEVACIDLRLTYHRTESRSRAQTTRPVNDLRFPNIDFRISIFYLKKSHETSILLNTVIRPSVVYSFATIRLGRLTSLAARSVTGPMQAKSGLFGRFRGSSPFFSAMATK